MASKAQIKQVRSLQQKKFRDELGLFVAEGDKCVEELRKGFELVALFREGENATRSEIEQMSGLQTPQGVIGVFRKGNNPTLSCSTDDHRASDRAELFTPTREGEVKRLCKCPKFIT
jgi:tRNA G18 (ribose-2'-O)-methylase SpoU